MKKFFIALLKAIVILGIIVILAMIGIGMDQQLWADRPEGAMGHPMPVYTMILPMLGMGLLIWICIIRAVVRLIKKLIQKIRKK